MRRLARAIFTVVSAASLLLCVATCVLWVRSYWVRDGAAWFRHTEFAEDGEWQWEEFAVASWPGFVMCMYVGEHRVLVAEKFPPWEFEWRQFPARADGRILDTRFAWERHEEPLGTSVPRVYFRTTVQFPYWPVVLAASALPATWLVHWRRRRRLRHRLASRLCPACGYDLRATPGRCPECGAEPIP